MKVEIEDVIRDGTSCNFCHRGVLKPDGCAIGFNYPYEKVYTIQRETGSGIKAAICNDCAEELMIKINAIKNGK